MKITSILTCVNYNSCGIRFRVLETNVNKILFTDTESKYEEADGKITLTKEPIKPICYYCIEEMAHIIIDDLVDNKEIIEQEDGLLRQDGILYENRLHYIEEVSRNISEFVENNWNDTWDVL